MSKKFLSVILSEFTYVIQPFMDTKQFMNLGDAGVNFCIVLSIHYSIKNLNGNYPQFIYHVTFK